MDGTTPRLGARTFPVSSSGGIDPHWRKDGREILYLASDGQLMAVAVAASGDAVSVGKPAPLFRLTAYAGGWGSSWTASADHSRLVVVEAPNADKQTFRVLTNWESRLPR